LAEERWIAEACLREEAARKAAWRAEKEPPQMMARFSSLEFVLTNRMRDKQIIYKHIV